MHAFERTVGYLMSLTASLHLFRVTSTNNYLHQKHTRNNSLVAWIISRPFSLLSYIPVRIATYLRIRFELIVGQFMPSKVHITSA